MIGLNAISAAMAVAMLLMVARGFVPLLNFNLSRWATWIVAGVLMTMITLALRLVYWDLMQYLIGGHWGSLRDSLGGKEFSTVFNVSSCVACWMLLKGRLYLIPAADRGNWRWWDAWLHPCEKCQIWKWKRGE